MNQPIPEPKTNEIYEKIKPSLLAGHLLISEMEMASLLRQAKDIPDFGQSETITGLLYIAWGKVDKGMEHCEKAIAYDPYEPAAWINYSFGLFGRRKYSAEIDVVYRGIKYESPSVIKVALNKALTRADIPMVRNLLPIMERLMISTPDKIVAKATLDAAERAGDDGIDELAACAIQIAESEGLPMSQTQIISDFDGNLVFCYRINNPESEELSRLNGLLVDLIIEKDLASRNGVAVFERA